MAGPTTFDAVLGGASELSVFTPIAPQSIASSPAQKVHTRRNPEQVVEKITKKKRPPIVETCWKHKIQPRDELNWNYRELT